MEVCDNGQTVAVIYHVAFPLAEAQERVKLMGLSWAVVVPDGCDERMKRQEISIPVYLTEYITMVQGPARASHEWFL